MAASEPTISRASQLWAHARKRLDYVPEVLPEEASNGGTWHVTNGISTKDVFRYNRDVVSKAYLALSPARRYRSEQLRHQDAMLLLYRDGWVDPETAEYPWAWVKRRMALDSGAPALELPSASQEAIVATYECFVEGIEGPTAFVRLRSEHGETLYGRYPTAKLVAEGISERQPFFCHVVESPGGMQIRLESIPEKELTPERLREIDEEVDRALSYDGPDDDY